MTNKSLWRANKSLWSVSIMSMIVFMEMKISWKKKNLFHWNPREIPREENLTFVKVVL